MNEQVFGFADRRDQTGMRPVTDARGVVVARIKTSWWTADFTAFTVDGQVLCHGAKPFIGPWIATGPTGAELLRIANFSWTRACPVTCRLGQLYLWTRPFRRNWAVTDPAGAIVLSSAPETGRFSFRPDSWIVRSDGRFTLAEIVAVVQLHRTAVKRSRSAGAASASYS